jgi:hypothetical protein
VTPASLVIAAALAVWGPVVPPPEAAGPGAGDAVMAPADGAAAAAATPTPPAPTEPTAPAAPAVPAPIIAKAPLDVRAKPTLVATPQPAPQPRKPAHKQWAFWALAGGFFAAAVVATYIATRPEPQAYRGNAAPYYVPFP